MSNLSKTNLPCLTRPIFASKFLFLKFPNHTPCIRAFENFNQRETFGKSEGSQKRLVSDQSSEGGF